MPKLVLRWLLVILIVSWGSAAEPAHAAPTNGDAASTPGRPPLDAAPVIVDGRPLFRIRGIPSFPASLRAKDISDRIIAVARRSDFDPKALDTREDPTTEGTGVWAGDTRLLIVVDSDAELEGVNRRLVAKALRAKIERAVISYREERTSDYLWHASIITLAATCLLALALWLTHALTRRLRRAMAARFRQKLDELQVHKLGVVQAEHVWRALERTVETVWGLVAIVAVFGYVDFALAQFPWTRATAHWIVNLAVDPLRIMVDGIVEAIPKLAFLTILTLVIRYVLKVVRLLFTAIESGALKDTKFDPEWAPSTYKVLRFAIIAFAVVVAYPYIPGSNTDAFKGVSVFVGVLFSMGASSIVANSLAGLTLVYRRAFRIGDRVKIGDFVGDVVEIRQHVTLLHTEKNESVVVPNATILSSEVVNYSTLARERKLILHSFVSIGYDTPWRQVEAMLIEGAARTPGLLKEPAPFVLSKTLDDFYVQYEINVYVDDASRMGRLYSVLHQNILDVFNEYGVQIMSPHFEGPSPQLLVVPKEKWFEAPARRPGT